MLHFPQKHQISDHLLSFVHPLSLTEQKLEQFIIHLSGMAEKKFGKKGSTILMEDGSQVEDIGALRENDHLFIF